MPHSLYATDTDLTADNLLRLPAEFGCPVWVYDAQIIRRQIAQLSQFDVVRFAQKACSNIHVLRLMREQGVKVDSVSLGEIERALAAGYDPQQNPEDIVFTADLIDDATLDRVKALQIPRLAARQPGLWSRPQPENQYRRGEQQAWYLVQPPAGGAGSDASLSAAAGRDPYAYWLWR